MFKPTLRSISQVLALVCVTAFFVPAQLRAHCEVPCGIYDDQLRFEAMLEDQKTIAKAIDQISRLVAEFADATTPLAVNQTSRWVATKEDHANRIQHTIAQYFMTQRITPEDGDGEYVKKLTTAHAVLRAAMKTKQDPSSEAARALRTAILEFHRAYEGR